MADRCQFIEDWAGQCDKAATTHVGMCDEHSREICCSCSGQATHTCSETLQFVCGFPLCDDCQHTVVDGKHQHLPKADIGDD